MMNLKTCFILFCLVNYDVTSSDIVKVNRRNNFANNGLFSCLGICLCDDETKLVDCSKLGLHRIPTNLPSSTITLNLSDNEITEINIDDLVGLRALQNLYLNSNHISVVHPLSLRELSSLKFLNLGDNKLNTWSSNITNSIISSLEVLDLSSNHLGDITRAMFDSSLRNLQSLILDDNGLRSIEDNTFSQLNELKMLSLKRNVLKTFSDEGLTFSGLQHLRELYLDHNFFNFIPEQSAFEEIQKSLLVLSFSNHQRLNTVPAFDFPNLQLLNMSYCVLEYVDNFTFIGTPQLRSLDIGNNKVTFLASESLRGLHHLQSLYLQQNRFVAVPYRALSSVSDSLKDLNLDDNAINRIVSRPVDGNLLRNLRRLSLHNTFVSSIDDDSFFRHLQSLKVLNISKSQLDRIPKEALAHLTSLEELDISDGLVTELNSSSFPTLHSLRHLRIDHSSKLIQIENGTFTRVGSNLTWLSIKGGNLEKLHSRALEGLDRLTRLDISYNQLRYGYPEWTEGKRLMELKLRKNFWSCDCNARKFQDWLRSTDYQDILDRDQVQCEYPRNLRGQPIVGLETNQLNCNSSSCPDTCLCGHLEVEQRDNDNKQLRVENYTHADCSGESLLVPPPDLPPTTLGLRLDLNAFTMLNTSTFSDLPNLNRLWLGNNKIQFVEEASFRAIHDLVELDLNSNQIAELKQYTFYSLTGLEVLRLDHNRLKSIPSKMFIDQRNLSLLDISMNVLNELHNDSLMGLDRLSDLVLAGNSLTEVSHLALSHLLNLRRLYLSENQISHLEEKMVATLDKLEILDLSKNRIVVLDAMFLKSPSIGYLNMESGRVEMIGDRAFAGLPKLRTLRLKGNYIKNISETAFSVENVTEHENQIQSLDLSANQLSTFPTKAFEPIINLKALYLNNNPIVELDDETTIETPYLPNLETMQIGQVGVTNVTKRSVFRHISSLRTLVMSNAKLSLVPPELLELLPYLETLILDGNPITDIWSTHFPQHLNLTSFSLNFNEHLTTVSSKAFSNLPNLKSIQLSQGSISQLYESAFEGLYHLHSLDLSNNQLKIPRKEWLASPGLKQLALFNNPWLCDCPSLVYKEWLAEGAGGLNPDMLTVVCDEPMHLKGTRIEAADIVCDIMDSTTANLTAQQSTHVTDKTDFTTTSGANKLQYNWLLLLTLFIVTAAK